MTFTVGNDWVVTETEVGLTFSPQLDSLIARVYEVEEGVLTTLVVERLQSLGYVVIAPEKAAGGWI